MKIWMKRPQEIPQVDDVITTLRHITSRYELRFDTDVDEHHRREFCLQMQRIIRIFDTNQLQTDQVIYIIFRFNILFYFSLIAFI